MIFDFLFKPNENKFNKQQIAFIYSQEYNISLDEHVFPGNKFRKIYELICLDSQFSEIDFYCPEKINLDLLKLVHTEEYLEDFFNLEITERTKFSELPLNEKIRNSFLLAVSGTVLATELVNQYNFIYNIGGGFHHSFSNHAEGFCYLNDVAVATRKYLQTNTLHKVLIIDLDVHQGNGNAKIFEEDKNVFTFSIHSENIYPLKQKSNLDIGLDAGVKDEEYLQILKKNLDIIEKEFKPDLIFYLAGADSFEDDSLGNLKISFDGLKKRDEMIKNFSLKLKSKMIILTAGGYAKNFLDTVNIHIQTAKVFSRQI